MKVLIEFYKLTCLPRGDRLKHGTAVGSLCDRNSNLVGHGSANPLLNIKTY
jgi:hypothetical protein